MAFQITKEFNCVNCRYSRNAREIEGCGWAGLICTVIKQINWGSRITYMVTKGDSSFEYSTALIVSQEFLCVYWEPKDDAVV